MRVPDPSPPISAVFRLLEKGYRFGVAFDKFRSSRRISRGEWPRRLPRPVVSIGNITVGGTGKTPAVECFAREWLRRGGRPALLSRGYRGGPDGNDEFKVLQRRLPGVPHEQNPDRYEGGLALLRKDPSIDLFLLDDGFQHRALFRDLDLAILDATRPFGFGHCLPRGHLREPWRGLGRADGILLTRTNAASPHKLAVLRTFLAEFFPRILVTDTTAKVEDLLGLDGERRALDRNCRYAAFCGIGNPAAFFQTIRDEGLTLVATRSFADHHAYSRRDLEELMRWAHAQGAEALICTEKDGVKLEPHSPGGLPVYQLRIHFVVDSPHPLDRLTSLAAR